MTYPWRRAVSLARSFVQSHEARRNIIIARADEAGKTGKLSPEDATSIALGVTFSVLLISLIGLGAWFFLVKRSKQKGDIESGITDKKKNWWMVEGKGSEGEKGKLSDWWRKSYAVPDRVEPPPSAGPRSSLQRLRAVLTRKGALRGIGKKGDEEIPSPPAKGKATSPAMTLDLPIQSEPLVTPRYPSVLERGYRVPLYPTQVPPKDNAPSRSLTSPAPPPLVLQHPITVAERNTRRKISLPPRVLKISHGRPLMSITERKMGHPRSPANRRRPGFIGQFKHPFIPLKDSDTDFPTISAPMPSAETGATNPKLSYPPMGSLSRPRAAPSAPTGPRATRSSSRRVPVPIVIQPTPFRSLMPATPRHLREETRVLPPGQSSAIPRQAPIPL